MHHNHLWISFLSAAALAVIIYTSFTAYDLWQYVRLDKQAQTQHIQWSVEALSDDRFIPIARYQFLAQGKDFQGETRWQESFLNEWTAKEAVGRLTQSPPLVWYDGSDPVFSTLQKIFPLKESFYTVILWAIALYFICLGYYVRGRISS